MADHQSEAPDGRLDGGSPDGEPWWVLGAEERALATATKRAGTRVDFAVLLAFFRARGRFPRTPAEVGPDARATLAAQVEGVAAPSPADNRAGNEADAPSARTRERYRAEIRAHFGFREATVDDAERLTDGLRVHAVPESRDRRPLVAALDAECRRRRVEPPTPDRTDRLVRTAVCAPSRCPTTCSPTRDRTSSRSTGSGSRSRPRTSRHPDAARLTWLAAYAHLRGCQLTDGLVDLLIETMHAIGARAERRVERRVERELLDDLKRVTGKQSLLFQLADAALARPAGTVREVVFPVVNEATASAIRSSGLGSGGSPPRYAPFGFGPSSPPPYEEPPPDPPCRGMIKC